MCAQYNPCEMLTFDNFKVYNEELYALEYPNQWITSHIKGTGPECYNCLDHASWRGVLIGYCGNCAQQYEGFSRGPGFCGKAVEHKTNKCPQERSAYNTYLKNTTLDKIGNIDFNPSHTIFEHIVWKHTIENDALDSMSGNHEETSECTMLNMRDAFYQREILEQQKTSV